MDFPEEFDEAMFLGWTPSCSLKIMNISENESSKELVEDCGMQSIRRLRINIGNFENISEESWEGVYNLTVGYIPTYNYY